MFNIIDPREGMWIQDPAGAPAQESFFSRGIFLSAASARHASERLVKETHRSSATGGFARVNAAPFPARCASYRAPGSIAVPV